MSNICIIITVIICIVFFTFTAPRLFGISPFVVQSASMEPVIPTGSVVFVNTKAADINEGDIITYSLPVGDNKAIFVTHRIYKMDADAGMMQTKGDNNDNADGWISMAAITGKVIGHIPACGFVLDALQKTGFILIAIWIFVINAILMMVPYILENIKNEKG